MFKRTVQTVGLGLLAIAAPKLSAEVPALELKPIKATNLFVPVGYDDNDEITIVVDGYLPDPCHKLKQPTVKVDAQRKTVSVMPMAALYKGHCPDVTVPFQQVVHVGVLNAGNYTVEQWDQSLKETLAVKTAAGPGPDDYLYAPIDQAQVLETEGGKSLAVLKGRFTNTCLRMQEVRVIDSGKTIEVLPIMEKLDRTPQGACERTEKPFEWRAVLPKKAAGRYLLHVRSLDGQAVNTVFSRE